MLSFLTTVNSQCSSQMLLLKPKSHHVILSSSLPGAFINKKKKKLRRKAKGLQDPEKPSAFCEFISYTSATGPLAVCWICQSDSHFTAFVLAFLSPWKAFLPVINIWLSYSCDLFSNGSLLTEAFCPCLLKLHLTAPIILYC